MLWSETEGWIGHGGQFTGRILIKVIRKEVEMRHVLYTALSGLIKHRVVK